MHFSQALIAFFDSPSDSCSSAFILNTSGLEGSNFWASATCFKAFSYKPELIAAEAWINGSDWSPYKKIVNKAMIKKLTQ